jgi:hypothetical protein
MQRIVKPLNEWRDRTLGPFLDRYLLHVVVASLVTWLLLIHVFEDEPPCRPPRHVATTGDRPPRYVTATEPECVPAIGPAP